MAVAKTTRRKKNEASKILDAVSGLEAQVVIEEIGSLQNSLQGTLAGVSAQISNKIEQMKNVDEAISLKKQELTETYGIEKEAMSLEDIRARKDEEEKNWEKSKKEREIQWEEEEDERNKRWQREEEERAYEVSQRKKRAQEDFNAEITRARRDEALRKEDLEREWQERENYLIAKEQEFQNLQEQVAGFDDRLKDEVAKAKSVAVNSVKEDYEHQITMLQKDIEAERSLNNAKVSAMDETINGLHAQISDLQKQLVAARADAKEVTNAALDSASGRKTIEAMQKANTQASSKK